MPYSTIATLRNRRVKTPLSRRGRRVLKSTTRIFFPGYRPRMAATSLSSVTRLIMNRASRAQRRSASRPAIPPRSIIRTCCAARSMPSPKRVFSASCCLKVSAAPLPNRRCQWDGIYVCAPTWRKRIFACRTACCWRSLPGRASASPTDWFFAGRISTTLKATRR